MAVCVVFFVLFAASLFLSIRVVGSALGGSGLLSVFFLFCRFGLFGFFLSLPFGLVLLAFLVAHMITPFRRSQSSIPASARSRYILRSTHISLSCCRHFSNCRVFGDRTTLLTLKISEIKNIFTTLMMMNNNLHHLTEYINR